MKDIIGAIVLGLIGLTFASMLIFSIIMLFLTAKAERACLEKGWTKASVTYNFTAYCKARIDQTDVTVPLEKATQR